MASPAFGLSPWRRRAYSIDSEDPFLGEPAARTSSPPPAASRIIVEDSRHLSTSAGSMPHREPIRSFVQGTTREYLQPIDSAQLAQTVRQDTAELASYALSDSQAKPSPRFTTRQRSSASFISRDPSLSDTDEDAITGQPSIPQRQRTTGEVFEVDLAEPEDDVEDGPSVLSNMLRRSPPNSRQEPAHDLGSTGIPPPCDDRDMASGSLLERISSSLESVPEVDEATPLLVRRGSKRDEAEDAAGNGAGDNAHLEAQKGAPRRRFLDGVTRLRRRAANQAVRFSKVAMHPGSWDHQAIWQTAVVGPVSCLPAVIVGLLLNILDALSYGMILFPLGNPIFASLGPAGISIFYVSTIISQLIFSFGSIFKGGVGSELIEVVPFFHSMAQTIINVMGDENPDAVIATAIVSYALSSMMTGAVFYLMGKFHFGYVVGFIPRHILIGCIGGVGFFLIMTGFEVSARMEGGLEYDLDTLKRLIQHDMLPLWIVPLVLALVLFYTQSKITSKYFLPLYILTIPVIFYFFVFALDELEIGSLTDKGWIFTGPPAGEPWWYFYTLYKFNLVHWEAIAATVPAMLALTFFGILHVPINVPALALNTGEDNADLDRELKLHGYSNFLSGCAGSIQNYLVYANTVFFMRSGGDSRLAGVLLAALTFLVMTVGPSTVGYIPVMMVGTLIFVLGFELLVEAVWNPRKKLKMTEYLTVVVIVLIMGLYDFVVGIFVGLVLAFVTLVFQTARVPAVRAAYSGEIVTSTVRRNFSQRHYLQQVGRQIFIVKLTGYLFWGTIVSVEERIRSLIDEKAFTHNPIRFLILDLWHVTGLDYSAGEAFNTISRILHNKGVVLILSGVEPESQLGRNLRAVGVGEDGIDVVQLVNLNSALESCENELLKIFYASQERASKHASLMSLDVPPQAFGTGHHLEVPSNSPRRSHLHEAARKSLTHPDMSRPAKWQSFKQPLPLLLQVFQGLSEKNEDFWFRATPYFTRKEYPAGTLLFKRGDTAKEFFLVEKGILRADYDLPQGWLVESIVAGTTCGELPFFSETNRTADVTVDRACLLWEMDLASWEKLRKDDPEVARELLIMSLKLTTERMSSITAYTLTIAG